MPRVHTACKRVWLRGGAGNNEAAMNLDALGELETAVMDALWSRAEPATARDVCEQLGDSRAYTTIMTTADRLHRKGLLVREKDGLAWRYQPVLDREGYRRAVTEHHAAVLIEAHGDIALHAFVDAAARATSLDRLARMVAAAQRKPGA
jgi:predicted transcriptional regulator